ncbi:MAG: M20 family metallo-hydrolase [Flavobacteriaceae bacterium]|nr:M20 family metallo-hydrolase [Flavobacteriaceae bacterium]
MCLLKLYYKMEELKTNAIILLKKLIKTPSFSSEEQRTALVISQWFSEHDIKFQLVKNNVWAVNKYYDISKPTLLLNSHHDTVKPNKGYTNDPWDAFEREGKLFGLGSNDAGGCLVSLMATFTHFYRRKNLKYNLLIVASAEEENSGEHGLRGILNVLPAFEVAIVGEPTKMQMAVAEKGLLVLDGKSIGVPGHAAHGLGLNSIYQAMEDVSWIKNHQFKKKSRLLGAVKMTVTQIHAGTQHNVIPAVTNFVVDVRVTDAYTNQEVLEIIQKNTICDIQARSIRHNSSSIPMEHPIVKAGLKLGLTTYGSATLSDQACLSCPSVKIGPGDTLRSHAADEYIFIEEVEEGIEMYIKLLNDVIL